MTITLDTIENKVLSGERISEQDALFLFRSPDLIRIGKIANIASEKKNGNRIFYNVNRHINPTNICVYDCKFCAYSKRPGEEGAYAYDIEEMVSKAKEAAAEGATEIHMVGGLHPRWKFDHYKDILRAIKKELPNIHLKGFTAVEIDWLARKARLSIKETLVELNKAGLDSMPGGGAEIFHQDIRDKITAKLTAEEWLDVHRTAHNLGMHSNSTMLYGHVETYEHRVDHMRYLRELQDETSGFNAFIPLSFQPHQNEMGIKRYTFGVDDLKTIAIARIFLDNFDHIKAYWIMLGQDVAQLATQFGSNDMDGTVIEEKISRAAGGRSGMVLTKSSLEQMIHKARKSSQERDTVYNPIGELSSPDILSEELPENFDSALTKLNQGISLDTDELKILSKHAPLHDLLDAANKIARDRSGNSATFGLSVRIRVKSLSTFEKATQEIFESLEGKKAGTTLVLDLAGVSKLDNFLPFNDLIKLIGHINENHTNINIVLASPKGLWKLAREEDLPYELAIAKIKEAGISRITSSYLETETNLTHSEVKMLYTSAGEVGLKTTGKAELACPPQGLPLWDSFIDRLEAINSVNETANLDVLNIEPAKATKLTPIEYLRALAIARIFMKDIRNISSPLLRIPSLSNKTGLGTEYTQHPQEKIAGVCLLAGSNDLGLLEEEQITIASIVEDIRSAGLEPKLRNGSYTIQSENYQTFTDKLLHIPSLI
jgi:aminodeoxyfutalosine synthase